MSPPRQASTVVVTGASGGIGRAVAQAFAARGDTVALLARTVSQHPQDAADSDPPSVMANRD